MAAGEGSYLLPFYQTNYQHQEERAAITIINTMPARIEAVYQVSLVVTPLTRFYGGLEGQLGE